ncbi:MAG: S-layer homology domain-containing protein [Oscillospiraceae bacterium]|nr:S-layer homology domain-containing protein [Oscillospiraceae bacterium]
MKWFFEPRKQAGIETYTSAAATSERPAGRRGKHRTGRLRAILAGVIAVCCFAGISVTAMALTYPDVASTHWAFNAVGWVSDNGYMVGNTAGMFLPGNDMTRAEIVTILYAMAGKPGSGGGTQYSDISGSPYYATPALWAKNKGLGIQNSSTVFSQGTYMTRVKMAEALFKFAKVMNWTTSTVPSVVNPYNDIGNGTGVNDDQRAAILWCKAYGIMNGTDTNVFGPFINVYRAQMAVMIKAVMDRASGFFPVNSVSVRLGMDTAFTAQYSTVATPTLQQTVADAYLVDAAKAFKKTWNIVLTRTAYWYPTGLPVDGSGHARSVRCDTYGCGNSHVAWAAWAAIHTHHNDVGINYYGAYQLGKGSTNITMLLHGFNPCVYQYSNGTIGVVTGATANYANINDRWLSTTNNYGLTTVQIKRTMQHEMSHIWGVPDEQCTSGQKCVVSYTNNFDNDGDFNRLDLWCTNCRSVIASKRAQKPA